MIAIPLVLTFASLAAGSALADLNGPTRGVIPPDARLADGELDLSKVPDFIVALGRDGQPVGYVSKDLVLVPQVDDTGRPVAPTIPVYGDDLTTVVGHMVPDRGFVALGTDDASVPTFEFEQGPAK